MELNFKKNGMIRYIVFLLLLFVNTVFSQINKEELTKELSEIDHSLKLGSMKFLSVVMNNGAASKEAKLFWLDNAVTDSVSVTKASKILEKNGFIDQELVGNQLSKVLYKRILRSGHKIMEKHIDLFFKAFKEGKIKAEDYAVYYDTYCVKKGIPQKYGTQMWQKSKDSKLYFFPIEKPESVDQIRKEELGLQSLKESFYPWDLNEYQKNLDKSIQFLEEIKR